MGIGGQVRRGVFLDRDGVINRAIVRNGLPYPPRHLNDVEILPGVPEAVDRIRQAGFVVIVVTNQPDVARGTTTREMVDAINGAIRGRVLVDELMTCFHDDSENCDCRKPRPGQFFRARDHYGLDLASSFMVGDRWRDIKAAANAGCRSVFIDHGYAEPFLSSEPNFTCRSLVEAAVWIIDPADAVPANVGDGNE